MRRLSLCTLLIASAGFAAPPALVIPAEVRPVGQYVSFVPQTDAVGVVYVGLDNVDPIPSAMLRDGRAFLLDTRGLAPAKYRFVAVAASNTGEQASVLFHVAVGDNPNPPAPPGPTPPVPPTPSTAPFPCSGLHVLIVEESAERSKLPQSQLNVLFSADVREYLKAKCANDATAENGKAYRIYDPQFTLDKDGPAWKAAMKVSRDSLPWIVISDGKTGYSGPLPKTVDETLTLLKKWGG